MRPQPPKSPKGPFGAKTSPFRAPLGPEGAQYQVKVCLDHEFKPAGPIGGSWDQICPPWTPRGSPGPQKRPFGAQKNLFACFLELGGSTWAITVLDEPGIPLQLSGHPTSLYLVRKEFPKKLGRGNLGIGPDLPFLGPSGAVGTKSGPLEPSEDLGAPQKGLSG